MKFIRHRIVIPESHSFLINKQNQDQNTDIIHSHSNYELNYVLNGRGRNFIGGNISTFGPGHLVLMGPDLAHCWEVDFPEETYTSYTIHFHDNLFDSNLFRMPEFNSLGILLERSKQGLYFESTTIKWIERELEELAGMNGYNSMLVMLRILGKLSEIDNVHVISSPDFYWDQNNFKSERINKVYEYVFRNFYQEIKIKDVADQAKLTETAFSAFFKKMTKKTFSNFIKEIRINYACKLLLNNGEQNISQICHDSGFNNVANFNRQFKEINGMSPREYRALHFEQEA
jgi:AraC-like DNA-binding protein